MQKYLGSGWKKRQMRFEKVPNELCFQTNSAAAHYSKLCRDVGQSCTDIYISWKTQLEVIFDLYSDKVMKVTSKRF